MKKWFSGIGYPSVARHVVCEFFVTVQLVIDFETRDTQTFEQLQTDEL